MSGGIDGGFELVAHFDGASRWERSRPPNASVWRRFRAPMTARGGRGDRRRGMCTGMLTEAVVCAGEVPANQRLLCSPAGRPPAGSAGHSGCGDHRGRAACCGDSRGSLRRNVRGMKRGRRSFAPIPATKDANLQGLYGSDGTRTRDLRRDRPVVALPG